MSNKGQRSTGIIKRRRAALHTHQKGVCFWCPAIVAKNAATLDELVPRSRGGRQNWSNIVMSCRPCNQRRGNDTAPAWAVELVRLRGKPT